MKNFKMPPKIQGVILLTFYLWAIFPLLAKLLKYSEDSLFEIPALVTFVGSMVGCAYLAYLVWDKNFDVLENLKGLRK